VICTSVMLIVKLLVIIKKVYIYIISAFIWYIKRICQFKMHGGNNLKSVRKALYCSSQIRKSKLFRNLEMHPEMSTCIMGGAYGKDRTEMTRRMS
jgi:hypothetical protein